MNECRFSLIIDVLKLPVSADVYLFWLSVSSTTAVIKRQENMETIYREGNTSLTTKQSSTLSTINYQSHRKGSLWRLASGSF